MQKSIWQPQCRQNSESNEIVPVTRTTASAKLSQSGIFLAVFEQDIYIAFCRAILLREIVWSV